jgi:enoyl-CoA hydratase
MNAELVERLHRELDVIADDPECRVVILTGAGRGFCAGLDLTGYGEAPGHMTGADPVVNGMKTQKHIVSLVSHLRALPQVVISAVNGVAAGGGLALVLGSDIRLGARSSRYMAAFIKIGVSGCDIGTSYLLPRLVGAGRAHEMMLTGRIVESEEAGRIGLVVDVVDDEQLLTRALDEAKLVLENAPYALRMTKETMWASLDVSSFESAVALENRTQVLCLTTEDQAEAVAAFLEKRPPKWSLDA